MGTWALKRVLLAAESVKGTAATGFRVMSAMEGQLKDTSELDMRQLEYYSGLMTGDPNGTPIFTSDLAEIGLEGDMTSENIAYILNGAWAAVTPTVSVGTATWVFPPPTTAKNTQKTFTIQTGDDTEQLQATYGFVTDFEIKGSANETTKLSSNWVARNVSALTTFSSATALTSTNQYATNLWKIYNDPASGTVGTTQMTATLREFTHKNKTGLHQKQFMDGVLYPTSDGQDRPDITLDLVLEYNSQAVSARAFWKAKSQRRIRLLNGATTATLHAFFMDMAAYIESVDEIDNTDGNTTIAIMMHASPAGTTTADYMNYQVVNALTAGL